MPASPHSTSETGPAPCSRARSSGFAFAGSPSPGSTTLRPFPSRGHLRALPPSRSASCAVSHRTVLSRAEDNRPGSARVSSTLGRGVGRRVAAGAPIAVRAGGLHRPVREERRAVSVPALRLRGLASSCGLSGPPRAACTRAPALPAQRLPGHLEPGFDRPAVVPCVCRKSAKGAGSRGAGPGVARGAPLCRARRPWSAVDALSAIPGPGRVYTALPGHQEGRSEPFDALTLRSLSGASQSTPTSRQPVSVRELWRLPGR